MYRVIQLDPPEVIGEYEDISDAAERMEELLRDGIEARIEYGGMLWRL